MDREQFLTCIFLARSGLDHSGNIVSFHSVAAAAVVWQYAIGSCAMRSGSAATLHHSTAHASVEFMLAADWAGQAEQPVGQSTGHASRHASQQQLNGVSPFLRCSPLISL